ncbi:MAG: putative ABC transporter ATP-binding protein YxlF [Actinobacteria bacterium ADurb.Bin346]|nr:MAG: putative ABC transporter ATP-binding protein YxlF [Actinobacteria bacterium ADurb.Bin346]
MNNVIDKPIIIAENLTKQYNGKTVVNKLNLSVNEGEIFGLLGPNGSGKSTVILMLLGLTEPSSGSVKIDGYNSTKEPIKVKRITGYLPERLGFYEDMTARQNLKYTADLNGIPSKDIEAKINEVLEIVGLEKNKSSLVRIFSKGMKQRLGIADVLIKDPRLVILDEPTEGLDIKIANQILENIQILNKHKNITFLICSHQLNLVQKICTRIGIMSKGNLIGEGKIDHLGRGLFSAGKFRIEVEVSEVNSNIIEKIRNLDKVVAVDNIENSIDITADEDIRPAVSKLIIENNLLLTRMNIKDSSLEEIYLKYFKEE